MNNSSLPGSMELLQPIKNFLQDPEISEIILNKPQEIWIEKSGVLIQESIFIEAFTEIYLHRLFQLIANENQQKISKTYPLLSGSLLDGSRVQLCIPPVSKHYVFSIRRKTIRNLCLKDYEAMGFYQQAYISHIGLDRDTGIDLVSPLTLPSPPAPLPLVVEGRNTNNSNQKLLDLYHSQNFPEFINQAILNKKNIVISGGTSSGKTTFLNSCLKNIPLDQRLIILEDTREIEIPHLNQVQLLAFKSDQGESQISMQDLVQCCLRLRPDRIIMGEIRGREIMDFVSACSTGHECSLTTIHANNPEIAFMRMTQMYKLNQVPSMTDQDILRELKSVIDIIIQINKTPEGRRVQGVYFKENL